eukprot:gene12752-12881_t
MARHEGAYISKWVTFAASTLIQASAGLTYSFSLYAPTVKDSLDLTQTQIATVGSAINIGGYFAIISGTVYDNIQEYHKLGPRQVCGVGPNRLAALQAPRSFLQLLIFATAAGNMGTWFDTSALVTNLRNFKNSRGFVVGVLKSFLGLSSSIYTTVYITLFEPDTVQFLLLLALAPSILSILLSFGLNYVPFVEASEGLHSTSWFSTEGRFLMSFLLVAAMALYQMASAVLMGQQHLSPSSLYVILGGQAALRPARVGKEVSAEAVMPGLRAKPLPTTGQQLAALLVVALEGGHDGHVVFVSLFSVANAGGRLLMGYIPEQHLHAKGTPRTLFLTITAAATSAASLAVAYANLSHLYIISILLGLAFGAHWSLLPAILRLPDTAQMCLLNDLDHAAVLEASDFDIAQEEGGIGQWLEGIGAAEVLEQFLQAELDMSVLPYLTNYDLEDEEDIVAEAAMQDQLWHNQQEVFACDDAEQSCSPEYLQCQAVRFGPDVPGDQQANQYDQLQQPPEALQPLDNHFFRCWWPAWRRLPGSNIVVDAFGSSSKALGCNRSWILTHFHADHYGGLTRAFRQGVIICTPVTAALVRLKLKVPPELLLPLPLGQEVEVEGTRIQLLDANHCPGAAMVLAHPPAGAPPVLHTGDARLTVEATQQQPALQAIIGKAVLVLDTTYADPAYCFPSQQQVLDWCLQAVKAEAFNPRCLFLFGSYTIGKERLFMHVAVALGRKVYVCAAKRSVMSCLDLPPEQQALFTTNHLEASIHVVPMRQVTLDAMESLLQRYKGRYTAVVGFQPTGWTHGKAGRSGKAEHGSVNQPLRSSSSARPSKRLQRGTVVLYQVPYSEHSSCAELQQFVQWLKPIDIIPSVSNDGGSKLKAMLAAVAVPPRSAAAVQGPMDVFARPMQQQRSRQRQAGAEQQL